MFQFKATSGPLTTSEPKKQEKTKHQQDDEKPYKMVRNRRSEFDQLTIKTEALENPN